MHDRIEDVWEHSLTGPRPIWILRPPQDRPTEPDQGPRVGGRVAQAPGDAMSRAD